MVLWFDNLRCQVSKLDGKFPALVSAEHDLGRVPACWYNRGQSIRAYGEDAF